MLKAFEAWFRQVFLGHYLAKTESLIASARNRMALAKEFEEFYYLAKDLQDWHRSQSMRPFKFVLPDFRGDIVPDRADPDKVTLNGVRGLKGKTMDRYTAYREVLDEIKKAMKENLYLIKGTYLRKKTTGLPVTEAAEKSKLFEAISLAQFLKQNGAIKAKEVKTWKKAKFTVDLTGWKYLDTLTPEQKKFAEANRFVVAKFFWASSGKNWAGYWDDTAFELAVAAHPVPATKESIQKALEGLRTTLIHELSHLGQTILQVAKNLKEEAGLPGRDIRNTGTTPGGLRVRPDGSKSKRRVDHKERDVEFYMNLGDAVRKFRQKYRSYDNSDSVLEKAEAEARRISDDFSNPQKGAKAYSEFMKAIREWLSVKIATKQADLMPPLGRPGGPCHVVKRVEEEVKSPGLSEKLQDKIEEGQSLSNPEAAKVYDMETERTKGLVTKLYIGPHAQYRMDLRSVALKDVKDAIMELGKEFHAARKSGDPRKFQRFKDFAMSNQTLEHVSSKGLKIVLAPERDGAKLITTFWKGRPDPAPPGSCEVRVAQRYLRNL